MIPTCLIPIGGVKYKCSHFGFVVEILDAGIQVHCNLCNNRAIDEESIKPAAEKLGVSLSDVGHYAQALARWTADGYPELTPEEAAARDLVCVNCDKKRPLGFAMEKTDTCNSKGTGCGSGRNRPPLWILRRLPNCHCPEGMWPGDVTAGQSSGS